MVPVVAKSFGGHRRVEALLGSICGSRVGKAQLPSLTEIGSILNELLTVAGSGVQRQTPTDEGWREFCNVGADNRSRTYDLLITNELLYQLSYIGPEQARNYTYFCCFLKTLNQSPVSWRSVRAQACLHSVESCSVSGQTGAQKRSQDAALSCRWAALAQTRAERARKQ